MISRVDGGANRTVHDDFSFAGLYFLDGRDVLVAPIMLTATDGLLRANATALAERE